MSPMSPVIVVNKDGNVRFVIGGAGGMRVPSTAVQVSMLGSDTIG